MVDRESFDTEYHNRFSGAGALGVGIYIIPTDLYLTKGACFITLAGTVVGE